MRGRCTPIPPSTAVVGVDVAKRSFVAVVQTGDGDVSKSRRFTSDLAGFEDLRKHVTKQAPDGWVVAFEPTGHYGEPLTNWLTEAGVALYQVQPVHTKRSKELWDGTRRKTDAKDAAVVADLCRRGIARPFAPLEAPFAELRVLCRHREQLVKRKSQLQNRLHWQLDVAFPEVLKRFYRVNSPGFLALVAAAPLPSDVLAMSEDALAEVLGQATKGMLGREQAREVQAAARTTAGVSRASSARRLAIRHLVEELADVNRRIAEAEAEMIELLGDVDYVPRLLSVPRLGQVTVAILLAEFGDLRSYRHARQLIAMAGLDLIEQSSGERRGHRHISRKGRRYVRQILFLAVLRLGWTVLSEPRRRMVEENKVAPTKAALANICRLLRILHALVRDDVDFDASRHTSEVLDHVA